MRSKTRLVGDTWFVTVEGLLDYETQDGFKLELQRLTRETQKADSSARRVIFDLKNLEFVGSSGITQFVQSITEFNQKSAAAGASVRLCNVGTEFQKVIQAFDDETEWEFHEISTPASRKSWN
jgi:anti-anti-sigma factor